MPGVSRLAFGTGALLGLTGVTLGALGAHALKNTLSPDQLGSFETAVRFQMYHAFFLLFLGIAYLHSQHRLLRTSIWLTLAGVLLFSGSIYLLVLTPLRPGFVTPLGGLVLIAAWLLCGIWALRKHS
ncbi:MAG: DUF423 domain-containing protein [Bacteroidetes bacterium]|nr:MAG: DUF423 domain-containing protein [Bacteroidota bacterium]